MSSTARPLYTTKLSARSTYPTFLSLNDSIILQLTWAWRGLYDSCRWGVVVITVASDAEIRANMYKSLLLNSVSLVSIYVFDLLLHPLVKDQEIWYHRNISRFYQVLWLLPVVGTSLYLNATWCSIIAKRAYILQYGGRPAPSPPTSYTGILTAIATSAYRLVMVVTSMLISLGLGYIPAVGPVAGFIFICWVDSFVWISRGLSLSKRIRYLEERWAYYFAFGLPSAALCNWGSSLANVALFALLFPAYIIMAIHARPAPIDPYNPMPPNTTSPGANEVIRHPSPFIPIRLPIFKLLIWLNDSIVRILNVIGGRPIVRHKEAARSRAFSDASESAEDGDAVHTVELKTFQKSLSSKSKPMRPAGGRINIGARKYD
ncbi:hypothetical protein BYT27DRAFT_7282228 [Phlegmacium glaucopus]|nr:hypothetical protein BYT27DRAFT_7282228 [Phlegmacium glaucopus]